MADGAIECATQVAAEMRTTYDKQLRFMLVALYYDNIRKSGVVDEENLSKILNGVKAYETKYPTTSPDDTFLPHIYYYSSVAAQH